MRSLLPRLKILDFSGAGFGEKGLGKEFFRLASFGQHSQNLLYCRQIGTRCVTPKPFAPPNFLHLFDDLQGKDLDGSFIKPGGNRVNRLRVREW